jgi:NADPH:quinone reductase and related Zn-dependent oxidoreductases
VPNQALVADPDAPGAIRLTTVADPQPGPDQVVVEVAHASANYGELRYLRYQAPGMVLGFDAAGTVVHAAADGSGPAVGSRVVAFGPGAWARRVAFGVHNVAVVPDEVDLVDAAALPMIGLTALRVLRSLGSVLGRRLLVTGASGGVGRCAVQLAALSGASVVAVSGDPDNAPALRALGAEEVVTSVDAVEGQVDGVLETVGGPTLMAAWHKLAPGGQLHSIGWASNEPVTLETNAFFALGRSKTLHSAGDVTDPAPDLALLVSLVQKGRLSPEIGWRGPWTEVATAADALFDRRIPGKIVLDVKD